MKKNVFGIDLGTTNSCISIYQNKKFEIIEIDHAKTVPSVIAFCKNKLLVGIEALNHSKIEPQNAISSIKRHMGDQHYTRLIANQALTPTQVSAKILAYLKEKAQEKLKIDVKDVVITVPAYFNESQRKATIDAGELANFNVLRIINEPTAASLAHDISKSSFDDSSTQATNQEKWLVYDLGGGTFDVTVLNVKEGLKEVLASDGNNYLGGDDFDEKIVSWIIEQLQHKQSINLPKDPIILAKLKHFAQDAKIALSTETQFTIIETLQIENKKVDIDLTIKRETFEALISNYIESTIEKVHQALESANCQASEIDKLLLVGGSTKIPIIKESLKNAFNLEGESYIDPDLSVSLGACVQGAISLSLHFDNIIIDVAPHSLGVATMGQLDLFDNEQEYQATDDPIEKICQRHPKTFAPVIQRNSRLPAKFVETFYTATDNQSRLEVALYQGESPSTKENLFIGSFLIDLKPVPQNSPVDIGLEYDLNGLIKINVSQEGNKGKISSYKMNLRESVLLNTDSKALNHEDYFDIDDETTIDHEDFLEESNQSNKKAMNLLSQRVIETLEQKSNEKISQLLEQYTSLLENDNNEDLLDEVEDKLYDWLDEQE